MINFLDLPREIRDRIYEHLVVQGTIPISSSEQFLHTSYGQLRHVHADRRSSFGLCCCNDCARERGNAIIRSNMKRTTRHTSTESYNYLQNSKGTRIKKLQQSYGQPKTETSGFATGFRDKLIKLDGRNLDIFLASRQIYHEASAVFYSCNQFDFACWEDGYWCYSQSLVNALGFLLDRPKHALAHLKRVRLALGGEARQEIGGEESWPKGQEFQTLCNKLGTECQLFDLDIRVMGTFASTEPHPCLEQLCKIKGLKHLEICILGCNEHEQALKNAVDFVQALRSRSLIGGEEMGVDGIDVVRSIGGPRHDLCRVSTWKPKSEDDFF